MKTVKYILLKRLFLLPIAITLIISITSCKSSEKSSQEQISPIIIPTHDWSSQIVMSYIVGNLFEKLGYPVKYIKTDSLAVYEAIRQGHITIEVEVWEMNSGKAFESALAKGGIVDMGEHLAKVRAGWWYPAYVEQQCPNLPNWEALNNCFEKFVTSETAPKGRYLDAPVDWHGTRTEATIKALKLNFKAIYADSVSTLWTELADSNDQNVPIVLYNWSPNFTEALYGGKFVEFPQYEEDCWQNKNWGVNPNELGDCGTPSASYLKKAAWDGMEKKWQKAYKTFTQVSFDNLQISTMAKLVDSDKLSYEEAAKKWLLDNETIWQTWLK